MQFVILDLTTNQHIVYVDNGMWRLRPLAAHSDPAYALSYPSPERALVAAERIEAVSEVNAILQGPIDS